MRKILGRSPKSAPKLVKLALKPLLLVFQFPIQNLNEPLVEAPEVIKFHILQFSVFHAQPHPYDETYDRMNLTKEKPPRGGLSTKAISLVWVRSWFVTPKPALDGRAQLSVTLLGVASEENSHRNRDNRGDAHVGTTAFKYHEVIEENGVV